MIEKLHYISQAGEKGTHLEAIEEVLRSGGTWIQLRIKEQAMEDILKIAQEAVALCKPYGAKLIVNDYPEIAKKSGADGVHLGLDDMPIAAARALLGKDKIIGGTANTFAHIQQRISEGVDYIGLGPFRFTQTKKNLSPLLGMEGYQAIMAQVKAYRLQIPIIAIGGIRPDDVGAIVDLGIHGVAVSAALTENASILTEIHQTLKIRTQQIC